LCRWRRISASLGLQENGRRRFVVVVALSLSLSLSLSLGLSLSLSPSLSLSHDRSLARSTPRTSPTLLHVSRSVPIWPLSSPPLPLSLRVFLRLLGPTPYPRCRSTHAPDSAKPQRERSARGAICAIWICGAAPSLRPCAALNARRHARRPPPPGPTVTRGAPPAAGCAGGGGGGARRRRRGPDPDHRGGRGKVPSPSPRRRSRGARRAPRAPAAGEAPAAPAVGSLGVRVADTHARTHARTYARARICDACTRAASVPEWRAHAARCCPRVACGPIRVAPCGPCGTQAPPSCAAAAARYTARRHPSLPSRRLRPRARLADGRGPRSRPGRRRRGGVRGEVAPARRLAQPY
jgi:hypothetical protein